MTDFRPTATLAALRTRAALTARLRAFFAERDYLEVETPALSADVVVDAHIAPLRTRIHPDPTQRERYEGRFLQTSPEFHLKRLVAAGYGSVWNLSRVFRDGEIGARHNPEFTMAEWYGVGDGRDSWRDQVRVTEDLMRALDGVGDDPIRLPPSPFLLLTYDDAFARFAGTPVLELTAADLLALAHDRDVALPGGIGGDRDGLLNVLIAELIEPRLGGEDTGGPCFLCDYPASQAALATVRTDPGRPPVAERFELYLEGVELCNGYQELTDPAELRSRIAGQNRLRVAHGLEPLPAESRLLAAMEHGLPRCSGVALGFDRLVMLFTGATTLGEVVAFPHGVA
ncbi:EF-P lysine aminoacylase EpmA [Alienimonas californiensis]|uniref:Elongation factor P--(R)-beta-lysine ligase n=1 Tax=Alienimonas californiensis TaxID=2527989 RepID=A0A517P910_9PLAN|nr:EF-P lysine aminoacylase EpmA [Alienimonas californiensis]QDT15851.1 Elongation factor P--(R)-beta-lysine ligase [Alienimonas californiensis]